MTEESLKFTYEDVDKAKAEEWLERNVSNRKPRPKKIAEYVRDMVGGKWRPVGDPIRFDTEGNLIDGQHRLLAVIDATSQKPDLMLKFLVVRGVHNEDRAVIDTGAKRTPSDQLRMNGYRNSSTLATAAKWAHLYESGMIHGGDKTGKTVTHAEVVDFVEKHPDLVSIVDTVQKSMRQHIMMPPAYIACGYYLTSKVHEGDAFTFFERLTDGVMLSPGDPILALRNRLNDINRQNIKMNGDNWLSLLLRAWNARREGRSLRVIQSERRGGEPIPVPTELV